MGTALANFTAFMAQTGPAYIRSAKDLVNEAVATSYSLSYFLRGRSEAEVIQGGNEIRDVMLLDDASTFVEYSPNDAFTWSNPQISTTIKVPWRFSMDHMSWTDQELELNGNGGGNEAVKVQYKNLKYTKEQRMWTSMLNGMEAQMWANPANQQAAMEASTGTKPYSIPAFVTEEAAYYPDGWTTIQQVSPTTESRWRNQLEQYDFNDPADTANDNGGLFDAFERMYLKTRFMPPPVSDLKGNPTSYSKFVIFTNSRGITLYKKLLRDSNQSLVKAQDPAYMKPEFSAAPVVHVPRLDVATLYDDGSSGYAIESGASTPGPRFYFISLDYLIPIFHARRYFFKKAPFSPSAQPFSYIQPVDCWRNLFCRSRARQGIVYPGA